MPELGHKVSNIGRLDLAVVAFGRRWFVRIPKPSQIRRNQCEVLRQQREKAIPVEAVLRCAMKQKQWWP